MAGKRKRLRVDCKAMAKCGLTSLSRCKKDEAGLPECETCTLTWRIKDRWKMIDRKPHKKCGRCGKFLPLDRFYPRKVKSSNGKVYDCTESVCKRCRSEKRYDELKKQPKTPLKVE